MSGWRAAGALAALWVFNLLSGCASLDSGGASAVSRAAPFDLLGRVLVNYSGRAFSSNVRWLHGTDRDEIWLLTPTGQALAYIIQDANGALLTGADQKQYSAARVEALTRQALGWEFPLTLLQHWVRGVPAPAPGLEVGASARDANGRVNTLMQDGWRITYDYGESADAEGLPRRVNLTRSTNNIRLVIDSWRRDAAEQ